MIIDLILDRKGGKKYTANDFYLELMQYRGTWPAICDPIITAMDAGQEQDVISELCNYIKEQGWPETICSYVSAVSWMTDDPHGGFEIRVKYDAETGGKAYTEQFTTWQPVPRNTDDVEQAMKPFVEALKIALNMGWQMYRKLQMEVPEIHQTLFCQPRDAESAKKLQEALEQAQANGKPFHGEMAAKAIIQKSIL